MTDNNHPIFREALPALMYGSTTAILLQQFDLCVFMEFLVERGANLIRLLLLQIGLELLLNRDERCLAGEGVRVQTDHDVRRSKLNDVADIARLHGASGRDDFGR